MTTYSTITDGQVDQDSPVTQPLITALRDNPLAIAERGSGAPFIQHMWHPYDADFSGDGDGVIYDHSVDGDVFSFESPTFEAGFDYLVKAENLYLDTDARTAGLEVYRETSESWQFVSNFSGASADIPSFGSVEFQRPYQVANKHLLPSQYEHQAITGDTLSNDAVNSYVVSSATAQRLSKFRIKASNVDTLITGGKVYMFTRKAMI